MYKGQVETGHTSFSSPFWSAYFYGLKVLPLLLFSKITEQVILQLSSQ